MAQRQASRWLKAILGTFIGLGALGGCAIIGALYYLDLRFRAPGPALPQGRDAAIVLLERGQGLNGIAAALEEAGVIDSALVFKLCVFREGAERALKAGEYAIPARASMATILDMLRRGDVLLHKVTVPEGLTSAQVLRLVTADPVLKGDMSETPAEGTLLPDTYVFSRGETRAALIARMIEAQKSFMAEAWPKRQAGLPLKTPEEALVLASIVEKETGLAEERPRVAAVFINRLKRGMRLQSDPTIIYGLTGGEPLGRGLRQSELARATPYNTYVIDGLPPTPIANPGRAAIQAVLNPPATNELFFVADGTGGHAFAATEAEHRKNVANWRAVERRRAQGAP